VPQTANAVPRHARPTDMLKLRFAGPTEHTPGTPAEGLPGVHVWFNKQGGVVARGFRQGGHYWMAWPRLATYRFDVRDPFITAYAEPSAPIDIIWDTYRRSVLPMAMQVRGREALHASAIVSRQGVVAFCAASETGKSTMAFGLRRRGFPQWSDDGVVFAAGTSSILSFPLPFEVRLRPGSRELLGGNLPTAIRFTQNSPGEQIHTEPLPIALICLLTRSTSSEVNPHPRVTPVSPASAFRAMLTHAHEFDPSDEGRRARMMQAYLDLVDRVPVCEVTFAPDREQLNLLLDTVVAGLSLELPSTPASVAV
jgi:hypothetical protein